MTKLYYNQMDESQNQQHTSQADIYKRIKVLGSGSYGRAFLVEEKETKQQWVIKQINLADLAPQEQEIALKEAKILQMLDHQNIIKFKEVYRTAKMKLNIVMEYASGGDLALKIKQAKEKNKHFSEQQILEWFLHLCMAIRYIHSKKIIHRDLKAQNVFLTQEGLVKLGDFGVAKILENTVSKARTVVGSPYYLSPQIIENKPYSFKTDIWSLGTLLFQMCALHPPFTANNLQFLALKIVQGGIPHLPHKYSQGLKGLVKLLLQTKQANRPTIGQIFKLKIIQDTIERVVNKSKIHPQTAQNFAYMSNLRPPPNLLSYNISENKSEIILSKQAIDDEDSPSRAKPKTPFVNAKRGPNNFFNRPISGRRKVEVPSNNDLIDLADLIQIKPSLLQKHEKIERPQIPLPIVNKISPNQRGIPLVLQKIDIRKTDMVRQKPQMISPPSTAFSKKKTSVGNISLQKNEEVKKIQQVKLIKPEIKKQIVNDPKKQKETKKFNSKVQIKKKTISVKKQPTDLKLQVFSQQVKKKIENQKKNEKRNTQKNRKPQKVPKTKKKVTQKQQKVEPVMQQEKYNIENERVSSDENQSNYYSNYDEDQFESYSEDSSSDVDLTFSLTANQQLGINFQKLLTELQKIKILTENGQDIDEMISQGETIPELIVFSNQIREDDTQFQSNSSNISSQPLNPLIKIDMESIRSQEQLENVRVQLQEAMGLENTLFVYHKIEQKIDKEGLKFGEEEIISQIIAEKPQISKETLKKYLGLIVAILLKEKNMF